jgi:Fe-Mn family superoxide dismutase
MPLKLPDLPYAPDALEPHIDAATMTIHHDKHHAAYVSKANDALAGTPLEGVECPWQVCERISEAPADKAGAIRNNAGGAANHTMFWLSMSPGGGGSPSGALAAAIDDAFGSFDAFKEAFANAAATRFGSGWAWLYLDQSGKLAVGSTANQDNPAMGAAIAGIEGRPLLGLDVWEHAYYLKYQNRRPDYVAAWWNVVDWAKVGEWFEQAEG